MSTDKFLREQLIEWIEKIDEYSMYDETGDWLDEELLNYFRDLVAQQNFSKGWDEAEKYYMALVEKLK